MNRLLILCFIFIIGCRNTTTEENGTFEINWEKEGKRFENNFAEGFIIEQYKNYFRLTISDPQSKTIYGKYILYREEDEKPVLSDGEIGIIYPIKTIASVSTTHLPFIKLLQEQKSLVGYAGQKFVVDTVFKKLFVFRDVIELGSDNQLDHEKVIELNPDVLMVYPFGTLNFKKIEDADIPVFYNTEYLELHPLGKTEWIKVFGILYGKKEKSDSIFNEVSRKYHNAKVLLDYRTSLSPSVFTGLNFGGTWHVPGGKSFQAKFFEDAQTNYVWKTDKHNNSLSLPAETIIDKCIDADYWVIVSAEKANFSYEDLMKQSDLYSHFTASKNKNIIFCNSNEKDFFGDAIIEPDVILSDLIYFLHFSDEKNYYPKYFYRLE